MSKWEFESGAIQTEKHSDGSGETSIWTDGLIVSTCDHRQDNLTAIRLKAGKKYRVSVEIIEL